MPGAATRTATRLQFNSISPHYTAVDASLKALKTAWGEAMPRIADLPAGRILGFFHVRECVPAGDPAVESDRQAIGPYSWLVDEVVVLAETETVPCAGRLGHWSPPHDLWDVTPDCVRRASGSTII